MASAAPSTIPSGLPGLDTLLNGGMMTGRAYQVRGSPGAGKTTFGWHFLTASSRENGETARDETGPSLLITFDEPAHQLRADAERFGIETEDVEILDLSPTSDQFAEQESGDLFLPPDLGRGSVADAITSTVEALDPARIVVDTMTHFRYLSADPAQERSQSLAFLRYLKEQAATIVLLTEWAPEQYEDSLLFLSDGIIELDHEARGHTLRVVKQRGRDFLGGSHAVSIRDDGMQVHPRFRPGAGPEIGEPLSSGVPALDALLGGGLEEHTTTMISGASGVGKTTLGLQFMHEAARRGVRSVHFTFEEERAVLVHRAESIGIPVRDMLERGTLAIKTPRPWSFTPGAFMEAVRREVEENDAKIVMIDNLRGYRDCMGTSDLQAELYRLSKYLVSQGATPLLVNEVPDVTGVFRVSEENVSHLADNLVFLRYLEMRGKLRKAIGVLKKRAGDFEKSLRQFQITPEGLTVGEPLTQLRGVLTGTPEWVGEPEERPLSEHARPD